MNFLISFHECAIFFNTAPVHRVSIYYSYSSFKLSVVFFAVDSDECLAHELVDAMIARSPEQRPTAGDVLKHPFFWSRDRQLRFFEV